MGYFGPNILICVVKLIDNQSVNHTGAVADVLLIGILFNPAMSSHGATSPSWKRHVVVIILIQEN